MHLNDNVNPSHSNKTFKLTCLIFFQLPAETSEYWYLTASSPDEWANVLPFIHVIKIRQIQSRLHKLVFRVDRDIRTLSSAKRQRLDAKIEDVRGQLNRWLDTIPMAASGAFSKDLRREIEGGANVDPTNREAGSRQSSIVWMYDRDGSGQNSRDYFLLQYHKVIVSLFIALLPVLKPYDGQFRAGAQSAASICIIYKRLNQREMLSFTVIALHSCFVAGLTLVYCLWREPKLFSYDMLEASRACSICLTVFGEKWPGAVKYRDLFDAISGSLLKIILGGDNERKKGTGNPEFVASGAFNNKSGYDRHGSGEDKGEATAHARPDKLNISDSLSTSKSGQRPEGILLEAVKEAFMEEDEDVPGGLQSWNMMSEMVAADSGSEPLSTDNMTLFHPCNSALDKELKITQGRNVSSSLGNETYCGNIPVDIQHENGWVNWSFFNS